MRLLNTIATYVPLCEYEGKHKHYGEDMYNIATYVINNQNIDENCPVHYSTNPSFR